MNKIVIAITSIVIVLITFGIMLTKQRAATTPEVSQNATIDIAFDTLEIANTLQEQEQGLMNRTSLCKNCGMLFDFETEKPLSFWMKNTQIPLDIIFIDQNGKIVTIHQNTTPLQTSPTYNSTTAARYVLETNAYFTKENNIQTGNYLNINKLKSMSTQFKNN
jgi:uncharacterized protein